MEITISSDGNPNRGKHGNIPVAEMLLVSERENEDFQELGSTGK